jgi:hypothetical protein
MQGRKEERKGGREEGKKEGREEGKEGEERRERQKKKKTICEKIRSANLRQRNKDCHSSCYEWNNIGHLAQNLFFHL